MSHSNYLFAASCGSLLASMAFWASGDTATTGSAAWAAAVMVKKTKAAANSLMIHSPRGWSACVRRSCRGAVLTTSRRRQHVAVFVHAGAGRIFAGPAVGPVVLRHASAHRVLVVEPHIEDAGPSHRL